MKTINRNGDDVMKLICLFLCISLFLTSCQNRKEPESDIPPKTNLLQTELAASLLSAASKAEIPEKLLDLYELGVVAFEVGDWDYIPLYEPDGTESAADGLYPFFIEGKGWGYIDPLGQIVVEPQYLYADNFYDGYACVNLIGTYTDSFGNTVDNPCTYIDTSGNECVGIYPRAYRFGEGLAVVEDDNDILYLIDSAGTVINCLGEDIYVDDEVSMHDSRLLFRSRSEQKYGYFDEAGNVVIPPSFPWARPFSEKAAAVEMENGNLGYIDTNGRLFLQTQTDINSVRSEIDMIPGASTCDFSEGIAKVDTIYIDKNGCQQKIENGCGMLSNGLIAFRDDNGKYGYANINGEVIIPAKYYFADDFTDCGLAFVLSDEVFPENDAVPDAVYNYNHFRGYIDTAGNEVIPCEYYERPDVGARHMYYFPWYGSGVIEVYKEGYTYYFNSEGTLIGKKTQIRHLQYDDTVCYINLAEYYNKIKPKSDYIRLSFDDSKPATGLYSTLIWNKGHHRWFLLNSNGTLLDSSQYTYAYSSREGYALVEKKNDYGTHYDPFGQRLLKDTVWTYVNVQGEECLGYYLAAGEFHDGIAIVRDAEQNIHAIDTTGAVLHSWKNGDIKGVGDFYNGMAWIQTTDDLYGYINTDFEVVIKPQYLYADRFSENLAAVCMNEKLAYLDKSGTIVIQTELDYYPDFETDYNSLIEDRRFSDGYAYMYTEDGHYFIDRSGNVLLSEALSPFVHGLAIAQGDNGKFGYINHKGEWIIAPQYHSVLPFMDNGLALVFGDEVLAEDHPDVGAMPYCRITVDISMHPAKL